MSACGQLTFNACLLADFGYNLFIRLESCKCTILPCYITIPIKRTRGKDQLIQMLRNLHNKILLLYNCLKS